MSRVPYWTPDLLADLEMLLDCGTPAADIAHRLDRTPATIARNLYRHGRPDLAAPFDREAWHARDRAYRAAYYAGRRARYATKSQAAA